MAELIRSLVTPLAERKPLVLRDVLNQKHKKNTELVLKLLRAYQI